ncbi:MAG: DinB family protein [Burkholderiales bacterium]
MDLAVRPDRSEAAEYYFGYIDQVPPGDICAAMASQSHDVLSLFQGITEEQSLTRYAPGKWTIKEVAGHLNDTERLFVFRAFWYARGFETPLPSFDPDIALAASSADARPWRSHVDEFRDVRAATLHFFRTLPDAAWSRRGVASDNPFTVRALAYLTVGHVIHHVRILRERYLVA